MTAAAESESQADTLRQVAIVAAEGATPDWSIAFESLVRAAQLGSRLAQAELAGLSGQWMLALKLLEGGELLDLSKSLFSTSFDTTLLTVKSPLSAISQSPRIAAIEGFIEPHICDWLIARARPRLAPAMVYDRKSGQAQNADLRTNRLFSFQPGERDLILALVRARIATVTQTVASAMESPKVLHYSVGQQFKPHFDIVLDPTSPDYAKRFSEGRQRVLTFLVALNDDFEGGETEFPALGLRWKADKGSALFFWSVDPEGKLDRRTLHAGLPTTRGEKWILSQWIGGRPPEKLNGWPKP